MKLRNLFDNDDNRAVSPVIGVILMVAITVILAAVIGTFVLGLGDQVQTTAPSTSISFDQSNDEIEIAHDGGDRIDTDSATVRVTVGDFDADWEDGQISAGSTASIVDSGSDSFDTWNEGDTIRVTWESADGSSSSTLGSTTVSVEFDNAPEDDLEY